MTEINYAGYRFPSEPAGMLPAALEAAMGEREGTLHVAIETYGTYVQLRMVASGRASAWRPAPRSA